MGTICSSFKGTRGPIQQVHFRHVCGVGFTLTFGHYQSRRARGCHVYCCSVKGHNDRHVSVVERTRPATTSYRSTTPNAACSSSMLMKMSYSSGTSIHPRSQLWGPLKHMLLACIHKRALMFSSLSSTLQQGGTQLPYQALHTSVPPAPSCRSTCIRTCPVHALSWCITITTLEEHMLAL